MIGHLESHGHFHGGEGGGGGWSQQHLGHLGSSGSGCNVVIRRRRHAAGKRTRVGSGCTVSLNCARHFTRVVIVQPCHVLMAPILQVGEQGLGEVKPLASGPTVTELGSEHWSPDHKIHALPLTFFYAREPSVPFVHQPQRRNTWTEGRSSVSALARGPPKDSALDSGFHPRIPALRQTFFPFLPVSRKPSRTQGDGQEVAIRPA